MPPETREVGGLWSRPPAGHHLTIGCPAHDRRAVAELDGRRTAWARGRGLGGSGADRGGEVAALAFARSTGGTVLPPASACRTAVADEPEVVRDLELRVRGTAARRRLDHARAGLRRHERARRHDRREGRRPHPMA